MNLIACCSLCLNKNFGCKGMLQHLHLNSGDCIRQGGRSSTAKAQRTPLCDASSNCFYVPNPQAKRRPKIQASSQSWGNTCSAPSLLGEALEGEASTVGNVSRCQRVSNKRDEVEGSILRNLSVGAAGFSTVSCNFEAQNMARAAEKVSPLSLHTGTGRRGEATLANQTFATWAAEASLRAESKVKRAEQPPRLGGFRTVLQGPTFGALRRNQPASFGPTYHGNCFSS